MNNLITILKFISLILFVMIILAYYFDVIVTLLLDPNKYIKKKEFLNKLSDFHDWKNDFKLFKKLPSAKEK